MYSPVRLGGVPTEERLRRRVTLSGPSRALTVLCVVLSQLLAASLPEALAARKPRSQSPAELNKSRAIASYDAMQKTYYMPRAGLYKGARLWQYTQAMSATISVASLPGMHARYRSDLVARLKGLDAYGDRVDPQPAG